MSLVWAEKRLPWPRARSCSSRGSQGPGERRHREEAPGDTAEPRAPGGSGCLGGAAKQDRGTGEDREDSQRTSRTAGRKRRAGEGEQSDSPGEPPTSSRKPKGNVPWLCRRPLRLCAKAPPIARFPGHFFPGICPIARGDPLQPGRGSFLCPARLQAKPPQGQGSQHKYSPWSHFSPHIQHMLKHN